MDQVIQGSLAQIDFLRFSLFIEGAEILYQKDRLREIRYSYILRNYKIRIEIYLIEIPHNPSMR